MADIWHNKPYDAAKENKLNRFLLLAGFGVGHSWGGVVLQF
jgi:hypothetical protein